MSAEAQSRGVGAVYIGVRLLLAGCGVVALAVGCAEPPEDDRDQAVEDVDVGMGGDTEDAPMEQPCGELALNAPLGTPADQCPSGEFSEQGICEPLGPELLPEEGCPGEVGPEGVCAPIAPELPWLPPWECPQGWRATETYPEAVDPVLADLRHCLPPPLPDSCPAGQMAVVGQGACVPIGPSCPQDALWHDEAAILERVGPLYTQVVYVRSGAMVGGVGTRERPFSTVQEALEGVEPGTAVAIAAGRYEVTGLVLSQRVALVGACAAEVTLVDPTPARQAVVGITSPDGAWVGDVTLTGPRRGITVGQLASDVVVQSVHLHETTRQAIFLGGGGVTLRDVLVTDTQLDEGGEFGVGLLVGPGVTADAERVTIRRSRYAGVAVLRGGELRTADLVVLDTRPDAAGGFGWGVDVDGVWRAERVALVRNHDAGLFVRNGSDTAVNITDALIADTTPDPIQQSSSGAWLSGGQVELTRAVFANNPDAGIAALGGQLQARELLILGSYRAGVGLGWGITGASDVSMERAVFKDNGSVSLLAGSGSARATDLVCTGTARNDTGGGGIGVQVLSFAQVELRRALLVDNPIGVFAIGDEGEARLNAEDLTVLNAEDSGVLIREGVVASVERARVVGAGLAGVWVLAGAMATMTDVSASESRGVEGVLPSGFGIDVAGELTLTRASLVRNRRVGLVQRGGLVVARDLEVTDTQPDEAQGWGRGVNVQGAGRFEAQRMVLARNHDIGLMATGEDAADTRVVLEDVVIEATQPQPADLESGHGIQVQEGAALEGGRVMLVGNHDVGLHVTDAGSRAEFTDLVVRETQPQQSDLGFGRGVNLQDGASLTLTRALLTGNHTTGLFASDPITELRATDLVIQDTLPREASNNRGRGLNLQGGPTATLERCALVGNHELGLAIFGARTEVTAVDVQIAETSAGAQRDSGRGVNVQGGVVRLERLALRDNADYGLIAFNADSDVSIADLSVLRTDASEGRGGIGAATYQGARLELERFRVEESALAGLVVEGESLLAAEGGEVKRNFIGLNIQTSYDYDLSGLACVQLRTNCCAQDCDVLTCNVERQDIAVPSAFDALEQLSGP